MTDSYLTISTESTGLFKDRGSKFYAFAYPVNSEDEIKTRLADLRKEYHDARHHCYAWRLLPDMSQWRANDDGEPSGSAGKPILNQIETRELTQVLVVVVRYFGGTLLGVGGLIHAYREAASDALEHAQIIKKYIYKVYQVRFEYSRMNSVMKMIKDLDLENFDHQFDMSCSLKIRVRTDIAPRVLESLSHLDNCDTVELGTE